MKELACMNETQPLTYEQEVHALLWHAKTACEDLIRYFQAQAKIEKGDAKKLTLKCIENEQVQVERIKNLIPRALERRDAAQPAAGTTPQAELLALRKKFKEEHHLDEKESNRSEELIEIVCGRAVAPVETRPQHAIDCEYQPKSAECDGIDCSCKETRLTARQWLIEGGGGFEDGEDGIRACTMSAEAAIELMDEFTAGLREEIERLKEGERLVRDFLERDYGVSEITTICSRYDDAEQELTELRAKLADAENQIAEHVKWVLRDTVRKHDMGLTTHGDGIFYNKRAEAAEAEAAALRERLKSCDKWANAMAAKIDDDTRVYTKEEQQAIWDSRREYERALCPQPRRRRNEKLQDAGFIRRRKVKKL